MAVPSAFQYNAGGAAPVAPIADFRLMTPAPAAPTAAVAVGPSYTPPAPTPTAAPTITPIQGVAGIAQGGFSAGAPAAAAYDTTSGIVSTLGAGAAGAAQGALIGSVVPGIGTAVGALAGGGIGLLTGGLNAWMSVGAQNKARRREERLLREAEAKQKRRDEIARNDAISMVAYQQREAALQKKWAKNSQIRQAIQQLTAEGQAGRDRYVATGRV